MSTPAEPPLLGLRERKKAKTRMLIQAHALRLFEEQGYDATTVEQIAAAAEVSESTFFRYFPAKADVVLWDEFDPLIVQAFTGQPPALRTVPALRAAFRAVFAGMTPEQHADQQRRLTLILSVAELRAALLDQFAQATHLIAFAVAERTGRPADDVAVRTLAGAVVGALMAVMYAVVDDSTADWPALLDESLAHLETGLVL